MLLAASLRQRRRWYHRLALLLLGRPATTATQRRWGWERNDVPPADATPATTRASRKLRGRRERHARRRQGHAATHGLAEVVAAGARVGSVVLSVPLPVTVAVASRPVAAAPLASAEAVALQHVPTPALG